MSSYWDEAGKTIYVTKCFYKTGQTLSYLIARLFKLPSYLKANGDILKQWDKNNKTTLKLISGLDGIRCSVTDQIGQTRNIYWNYHEKEAIIVWTDDNTVIINNHSIDVRSQKYDYRVD